MTVPFFPGAPDAPAQWTQNWGLRVQSVVNMLVGKANCAADLTLTPIATATVMLDGRLSAVSVLTFMPVTASAAIAKPAIYVTDQKKGSATINHASAAAVNQTFRIGILG